MRPIRRAISIVLALSLVLGFCPQTVWAEETEPTQETETAVSATTAETTAETVPETTVPTEVVTEPYEEITVPTEETIVSVNTEIQIEETASSPIAMASVASGTCGNNLTWALDSGGALTISGTGAMTDWTIFTSAPWNSKASSIKTVLVEDGVTNIGAYAFKACSNLSYVILPDSVTEIKSNAFLNCTKLSDILLPDNLSSIGAFAFQNSGIVSIDLPSSLTSIGNSVFNGCSALVSIGLPDNLTNIPSSFFQECSSMSSIILPQSITSISSWAFYGCTSLKEIVLPDNITILEDNLFNSCTSLGSITVPENVTTINSKAFYKCTGLTSIVLPRSLTSIGSDAFQMCNYLTDIYYTGTEEEWAVLLDHTATGNYPLSDNSVTVHYNWTAVNNTCGDNLTWTFDSSTGTLTISGTGGMYHYDSINMPPYSVFIRDIRDVVIEEGVTSIGDFAFYLCSSLDTVTIPNTVIAIGDCAFSACTGLTNFNVPTQTTTIGQEAFSYTNLKTITIPGTVTSIGQDAFLETSSLTDVYFDGYLSEWETLGVTLEEEVKLHYVLDSLQQQWVDEHMDYIFSNDYEKDIIGGFDGWMLEIFRIAQDDGGIVAYDLAEGLSNTLGLDFKLSGVETYELILSMILYDRSALNAGYETYAESYYNNISVIGKVLFDIGNSKELPKDVKETIDGAYKAMTESDAGSNAFFDAYDTLAEQLEKHFTTDEMKARLKEKRILEVWGLAIDGLFAAYGNLQDVLRYAENYRAYQVTSRYFKQALQTMGAISYYYANSAAGPLAYNPFNELGFWTSNMNWAEFQTALNNFINALDEYETEGADLVASKFVEEAKETGEDILEIVGRFGLETLLNNIPVIKALNVVSGTLNFGLLMVDIFTKVDDRKAALDMMTKVYCLSVLLDKSIDACADIMDYDNLEASMVFDESVQIYVSNQNLGLDYAIKYAELRLKNAIADYRYYRITHDEVSEKKLNELNREINIFTGYIELLNMQRGKIRKIACHDPSLEYVPETDVITSEFLDARAFVVACPVSVTVTNSQDQQIALLTNNGSQVAEGYEFYFRTIPLNDGSGEHIKIAIVPKDYTITLEGTDQGEMNAFVTDYAGDSNTVNMYLSVPVDKGAKGGFAEKLGEPEILELTMGQSAHSPIVSGPQPGDVNLDGDVTMDDAKYLLWHTLFPELYPITVNADFDGNNVCDSDDAVLLLWYALFPDQHPLS